MMVLLLCIAALLCPTVYCADTAVAWCYHKPTCNSTTWPKIATQYCNGIRQSPININTSDVQADPKLAPFNITGFNETATFLSIGNLGDSVLVKLDDKITVGGGGLPGTYTAAQFHLHWGDGSSGYGSEHTVDGKGYPMELHIVTVNSKYKGSLKDAVASNDSSALAVLGFFVEGTSTTKSKSWETLTSYLSNITYSGNVTTDIMSNNITTVGLLEGVDMTKYYRYEGSLTTPNCNEVVIWTVFKDPIKVHQDLIRLFSTSIYFQDTSPKALNSNNFRNVQALNGRKVTKSSSSAVTASAFSIYIILTFFSLCWL